jgi:hypothetical protein
MFREFSISHLKKVFELGFWQGFDLEVHGWSAPILSLPEYKIQTGRDDPILALSLACSR